MTHSRRFIVRAPDAESARMVAETWARTIDNDEPIDGRTYGLEDGYDLAKLAAFESATLVRGDGPHAYRVVLVVRHGEAQPIPEWRRRAEAGQLRAKDMTGAAR